jgi:hypothetical protein
MWLLQNEAEKSQMKEVSAGIRSHCLVFGLHFIRMDFKALTK